MSKGLAVIAGYGRGISHGMATKLGSEGFSIALLSRTQAKLDAAAAELGQQGIVAKGYATDLSDAAAVTEALALVQRDLGPATVLFWNPSGPFGTLLDTPAADWQSDFNVAVTGLVAAVKAALDGLKAHAGRAAVLVTGGGLSVESDTSVDKALAWAAVPAAVAKSAQRKLVHLMNRQLARDGIYAFQLTVAGLVTGTDVQEAWAPGTHTGLTVDMITARFWQLYKQRDLTLWQELIAAQQ